MRTKEPNTSICLQKACYVIVIYLPINTASSERSSSALRPYLPTLGKGKAVDYNKRDARA